jgi:hypothetical protein
MVAIVDTTSFHSEPQLHSTTMQAEHWRYQLPGVPTAAKQAGQWIVVAIQQQIFLYNLGQLDRPRRTLQMQITPKHLLFSGVDQRYVIAIDALGNYELWDRVTSLQWAQGQLLKMPKLAEMAFYEVIAQRYLLVAVGKDCWWYSIASMDKPIAKTEFSGTIKALQMHEALNRLYVVYEDGANLVIESVPMSREPTLRTKLQYSKMHFSSMNIAGDQLLLQVYDQHGQIRMMQFDLSKFSLESSHCKSMAYQAHSVLNPMHPWVLTPLPSGLLLSDHKLNYPIAYIDCDHSLSVQMIAWTASNKALMLSGDELSIWQFHPQNGPPGFHPEALQTLTELQQWLEVGKTDPQVRLLYGAPSIGKTFLCRASAHWNFPKMLYLTSLSSWDWRALLRQLCIFLCPDDDLTALTGEALLDLFMTRVDPGTQILLDQSEHLADEIIPHLFVLSRQKDLSIILITNTMPAYQVDTFYLQPIAQSLEFHQLAQFYAPVTIQHRLFVDTIRPILDDAARYHLRHQKATAQN